MQKNYVNLLTILKGDERLSNNYEVRELKSVQPQVRVVGIIFDLQKGILIYYYIRKQNDIFMEICECTLIKVCPTKSNKNVKQTTLQIDIVTYKKILIQGHLLVGLDECSIYDAIFVPRCYNCNGYFHSKDFCRNYIVCSICSKSYNVKDCSQGSLKCCINCHDLKMKRKLDISIDHATWDYVI